MYRYHHTYVPTPEEKRKSEEYKLRVKVFDELKIKYNIENGESVLDTLDKLKDFLKNHYQRVPLTFFTLYSFLEQSEITEVEFNEKIDPFDRTMENGKFSDMDFDKCVRHIANVVEKYRVSPEVKAELKQMYDIIYLQYITAVNLTLKKYKYAFL